MHELTHPVELRDEELDLVAAGGGSLLEVDADIDVDVDVDIDLFDKGHKGRKC
jgi:hypothetical protein